MITRDISTFTAYARGVAPDFGPACASAAFVVSPDGFALAAESASDNAYMDLSVAVDPGRALAQHRGLQRALSASLPVVAFPGDPDAPDGLFPNNVFATAPGRLLIGHMRHPVRRREAERPDIRGFFTGVLGRREVDLRPGADVEVDPALGGRVGDGVDLADHVAGYAQGDDLRRGRQADRHPRRRGSRRPSRRHWRSFLP